MPAHQYQEMNEMFHFDLFKAAKQDPTADINNVAHSIFPSLKEENPSASLLEKEAFHEMDELM